MSLSVGMYVSVCDMCCVCLSVSASVCRVILYVIVYLLACVRAESVLGYVTAGCMLNILLCD